MSTSKPLPILPQMPWNVKQLIANHIDPVTKLSLRQCSKKFKMHVDKSKTLIPFARLFLYPNRVSALFRLSSSVSFERSLPESPADYRNVFRPGRQYGVLITDDLIREAVNYFMNVLKRKNISVVDLKVILPPFAPISSRRLFMRCLTESLQSVDHLLKAETLVVEFDGDESVLQSILPYLEPGTLKTIQFEVHLFQRYRTIPIPLQSITQTEQFKQAKQLHLHGFSTDLPEADIEHFNSFSADVHHLTLARVKGIVERALQNPNFGSIRLRLPQTEHFEITGYCRRIGERMNIPGGQEYLTVRYQPETRNFGWDMLEVTRIREGPHDSE